MKKYIIIGFLLLSPFLVSAAQEIIEVVFDPGTNLLRIPQVRIGDGYVYDAQLRYTGGSNFVLERYSETPPSAPPPPPQ
ncbi:MAG: hypothetical protein ABL903_18385 [Methylococcales bacterium]